MSLRRICFAILWAIIVLTALSTACDQLTGQEVDGPPHELSPVAKTELEGTNWFLLSYGPVESQQAALENVEVSVGFDNYEDLHGFAGCNYYAKSFDINGQQLITGDVERTRFPCPDDDVMVQDAAFLEALQTISTIGLQGEILVIGYDGGELRFEKEPPPSITPLTGTRWELVAIVAGDEVRPIVSGATITAAFQGGIMSGESGCNSYGGEYAIDGSSFSIDEIAQTAELCLDQALMDQEETFIDILREATDFLLEDETLIISRSGAELRLRRADG